MPGYIEFHEDAIYLMTVNMRWHQITSVYLRMLLNGAEFASSAIAVEDTTGTHIGVEVYANAGDRAWWDMVITFDIPEDEIDWRVRMTADWRAPAIGAPGS